MSEQALSGGLRILRSFDAFHQRMAADEISFRSGLSRATTRKLLAELMELGYVVEDAFEYSLTPEVLELGCSCHGGCATQSVDDNQRVRVPLALIDGEEIVFLPIVNDRVS